VVGQPAGEHGVAAGFVDLVEQRQQLIGDGVRGVEATADHSQWGAMVNSGGRTRLVPKRSPQGRPARSEQVDLEGWVDAVEPAGVGG